MKQTLALTLVTLLTVTSLHAQNTLNDLNVIFKHDFENNTLGDYLENEYLEDWNYPTWNHRQATTDIVQDDMNQINPSKSLQVYYPQGEVSDQQTGVTWYTKLDNLTEVYVSYDIMFMPGFQYALGGKLPSVMGGMIDGKPTGYDGFTGGLMFHKGGLISFYTYYPDSREDTYGETVYWGEDYARDVFSPSHMTVEYNSGDEGSFCRPGEWHNITYRMVLNTVTNGTGDYNGILEGFFDGKLVTQLAHIQFRHTEDLAIDCMRLYTFFGGSSDEWRVPIDEWVRFDNVILYTFRDDINVPRGNELSPSNRTINYWRNFLAAYNEPPATPGSFTVSDRTKSSISLRWTDVSNNEHGFKIFRSSSPDGNFSEIGSVPSNVINYTDNSLALNTTYYYKIQAFNNAGTSGFSQTLQTSTLGLQIPEVPGQFTMSSLSYTTCTITWKDLSGNETGFEVERKGPDNATSTVKKIGSNVTSYTDEGLVMNSTYQYRIRAYNNDGYSPYSSTTIQITTPYLAVPSAPSMLKGTAYTDSSITITWKDNSVNESAFIITRSLVSDPSQKKLIQVSANDTSFIDNPLMAATSYQYTVQALNSGGNSASSNKRIATTLTKAEMKRVKDGLIAYYNFGYNPDLILYDQSSYSDPVDLRIQNPSAVVWNKDTKLSILSNTTLISQLPAKKIVQAVKKTNEITVECWVKPAEPYGIENSRLVSLSVDDSQIGFALDQTLAENEGEKTLKYLVRLQTSSTNESGYPEFIPEQTTSFINLNHIVYIRKQDGTETLYINGHKSSEGFRPDGFEGWSDNFYLRFGNEKDAGHSWQGTFYSVAFFNRALRPDEVLLNYGAGPCDSLSHNSIDYQVKLYPNPVKTIASVEINPVNLQDMPPVTSIRLVDIFGKVVLSRNIFNPNVQHSEKLDLSGYPAGIYLLQVISGNRCKSVKVVVE